MRKYVGALVAGTLVSVATATGAGAYIRNAAPVAGSVVCVANSTVAVSWSKDAGKPSYVLVSPDGASFDSYPIANKLMSKGYITLSYSQPAGTVITAFVMNPSGQSSTVTGTC